MKEEINRYVIKTLKTFKTLTLRVKIFNKMLKLHYNFLKIKSSLTIYIRTEKINLAMFLHFFKVLRFKFSTCSYR